MKKLLLVSLFFCSTTQMYAAKIFGSAVQDFMDEIKTYFIPIIVIVFLVCAAFNVNLLMGEKQDVKKFFANVMVYAGGISLVIGLITYLSSLSI